MKPLFNQIKIKAPKRNAFDLSFERKMSFNMGELVPTMCQEIVPGDRFKVHPEMLLRFAPMVAPVMHRINLYLHFFFVPNRLVWDNWQTYITGGVDGAQTPTFPEVALTNANKSEWSAGTLADYLGIPDPGAVAVTNNIYANAMPFRAYQLIYNEYYRDQTQHNPIAITKNDTVAAGAETTATLGLRMRCWEKDYFTSALPWSQRGGSVMVPTAPNYKTPLNATAGASVNAGTNITWQNTGATSPLAAGGQSITQIDNLNGVDISVTNLRRALKLQEWFERNATAGSRYIEQILAHFGVKSSDSRLQRPEYLGGIKNPVTVSEVVSMVKETSNPQGTMTGHGISVGSKFCFDKEFEEHGFLIGIVSVLPKTAYQQGVHRMFNKTDRFDYFWPELAHIGEQAIRVREIYKAFTGTDTSNNIFGYTPRYAEYKYNNSSVHGDFRNTLNYWHEGRIFSSEPGLNAAFMSADPSNRIFAVADASDHLWLQIFLNVTGIRPMPVFGTPML